MIIAGFASWHEHQDKACAALESAPHLIAHCALESYAVLTRLPAPHRASPKIVVEYLRAQFPDNPISLTTPVTTLVERMVTAIPVREDGVKVARYVVAFLACLGTAGSRCIA